MTARPDAPRAAGGTSAARGSEAAQASAQLPADHPHVAYAAAQIPPLPSRLHTGEDWQYVGSAEGADGYRHTFRHPRHPLTGRPELRTIETRAAEVAARPPQPPQENQP
jgi:hypothetical protein